VIVGLRKSLLRITIQTNTILVIGHTIFYDLLCKTSSPYGHELSTYMTSMIRNIPHGIQ